MLVLTTCKSYASSGYVNEIQTRHFYALMTFTNEITCSRRDMTCANKVNASSSWLNHPSLLTL